MPSLSGAPATRRFPSSLRATAKPNKSSPLSPSISNPACCQLLPFQSYTLMCPESFPFPLFCGAPIATLSPVLSKETDHPLWSTILSPSKSDPSWFQLLPSHSKSLTWPVKSPLGWSAPPIAIISPFSLMSKAQPNSSLAISPTRSVPNWFQLVPSHRYTWTEPLSDAFISKLVTSVSPFPFKRTA